MAKVILEPGDRFSFGENGYGIALQNETALLISGEGGNIPYLIEKGKIPADINPAVKSMPAEIKTAFDAVSAAMEL